MEFTRRVYEDGKITIPKELRLLQGIKEGDFVRLQILEVSPGPNREPAGGQSKGEQGRGTA